MTRPLALLSCVLLVAPALGQAPPGPKWSERFPALAARVRHFDLRLASPDENVRKRVITELLYFQPRNSKAYTPFLRALLKDPSPTVRGLAIHHLCEHHVYLTRAELPDSFHVHFVGEFRWREDKEMDRVRAMARSLEAQGGWAIHALGIVGDQGSAPLARRQLASKNVFTRFSAAVALVRFGEKKEGMDALREIRRARDDESGYYRYRSAESLVRFGEREAIEGLIDEFAFNVRWDSSSGPLDCLEDLTGQYFLTAAEWRKWWAAEKAKGR